MVSQIFTRMIWDTVRPLGPFHEGKILSFPERSRKEELCRYKRGGQSASPADRGKPEEREIAASAKHCEFIET